MPETQPLPTDEVERRLKDLPGWKLGEGEIYKWYKFDGYPSALAFLERTVEPAERMHHHPDVEVHERRVRVALHTWSAEAITEKDFALAAEIERVADG
ncbi:MAG: 4a-hydroxytetrahydrobiopterin dehydratase [Actinomycetota bacterium]